MLNRTTAVRLVYVQLSKQSFPHFALRLFSELGGVLIFSEIKNAMLIDKYQLFIYTVEDLQKRIDANDYYSILRGCGLCRQLIIDTHPLVHKITREYRLKIMFKVGKIPEDDIMYNIKLMPLPLGWVTINPSAFKETRLVELKPFLKIPLLKFNEHIYTVRDVIDVGSNIMGGIHAGKPENDKEKAMLKIDKAFKHDERITFLALRAICKVVLDALKPLSEKVKVEHSPAGGFRQSSAAN